MNYIEKHRFTKEERTILLHRVRNCPSTRNNIKCIKIVPLNQKRPSRTCIHLSHNRSAYICVGFICICFVFIVSVFICIEHMCIFHVRETCAGLFVYLLCHSKKECGFISSTKLIKKDVNAIIKQKDYTSLWLGIFQAQRIDWTFLPISTHAAWACLKESLISLLECIQYEPHTQKVVWC